MDTLSKKSKTWQPITVNSISALHKLINLPGPSHPLISVMNCSEMSGRVSGPVAINLYSIALLHQCPRENFKYGQGFYHLKNDAGVYFLAPGHVVGGLENDSPGLSLVFHADLFGSYPLAQEIKEYPFFPYSVNKPLSVTRQEEQMLRSFLENLCLESQKPNDPLTRRVIISQLELLLNYCFRIYQKGMTYKPQKKNDLLTKLEAYLDDFVSREDLLMNGVPTVKAVSEKLNVSPTYLSDVLRSCIGQSTQQFIHTKLMEKAKILLATTNLSISHIAYNMGFDYPQSFNKIFKKMTNMSPMEFRKSFYGEIQ